MKRLGFSDAQIAYLFNGTGPPTSSGAVDEAAVRAARLEAGVRATFKTVDTCSAEFAARTPYHYATYEDEDEVLPSDRPRIVILGSGPNRIGQGIEFDYCCVHALDGTARGGLRDRDGQLQPRDRLDRLRQLGPPVLRTAHRGGRDERDRLGAHGRAPGSGTDVAPLAGVIVALGGQTPLKLAHAIDPNLVLGTSPASIDLAEDREQWNALCQRLGIPQPPGGTALTVAEALAVAAKVGYPVLVRPSYVLGGRAMEIVYDDERLGKVLLTLSGALEERGRRFDAAPRARGPVSRGRHRGGHRRRARQVG